MEYRAPALAPSPVLDGQGVDKMPFEGCPPKGALVKGSRQAFHVHFHDCVIQHEHTCTPLCCLSIRVECPGRQTTLQSKMARLTLPTGTIARVEAVLGV